MRGWIIIETADEPIQVEFTITEKGIERYRNGEDREGRYLCFNYLRDPLIEALVKAGKIEPVEY